MGVDTHKFMNHHIFIRGCHPLSKIYRLYKGLPPLINTLQGVATPCNERNYNEQSFLVIYTGPKKLLE